MGPKMSAFGGAEWDGVFFNWMTPEFAAQAREWVEEGASEAGREPPPVFGYVRTAVGANAEERLAKDESFYRDMHQGYRSHFDRQGAPEGTVGVAAENAGVAQEELSRYRALDTVVVRALASATFEDMSELAEAAGGRCAERRCYPQSSSSSQRTSRSAGVQNAARRSLGQAVCFSASVARRSSGSDRLLDRRPRAPRSHSRGVNGGSCRTSRRAP